MQNKKNSETILLQILQQNKCAMSDEELASRSNLRVNSVRATLGKMVKDRSIRRAGAGKFCLSSKR